MNSKSKIDLNANKIIHKILNEVFIAYKTMVYMLVLL